MAEAPFVYLFVVCPNNSGSTLIVEMLRTSAHAATFETANREGQWLARTGGTPLMPIPDKAERRNWTIHPEKFENPDAYDWPRLKAVWAEAWGSDRRVRVEKTPSMVLSAPLFERHFENAHFILSIRNPYAFCEGVRRREGRDVATAARHWLACARYQQRNRAVLARQIFFSYEELCADPHGVADRLTAFVPALGPLDAGRRFDVLFRRSEVRDLNASQIARLTVDDIDAINRVLDTDPALLEAWGYGRLSADGPSVPAMRAGAMAEQER